MRLDMHVHVGVIYGGRNDNQYSEPAELAQFLKQNKVTHAGVCYGNREAMEKLISIAPDIKFYKLQWVTAYDQPLDEGFADGFKLHSHRGISPDRKASKGFQFGEEEEGKYRFWGMDYLSRKMNKLLTRMPKGSILQYHVQGTEGVLNPSRPAAVARLAYLFPDLKHIVVHGGTYGHKSFYPADRTNTTDPMLYRACMHEIATLEAALFANTYSNVYLDSSVLITPKHFKTQLFRNTQKVAFGSDYPFGTSAPAGPVLKAEGVVRRAFGWTDEQIQSVHERAISFLENSI